MAAHEQEITREERARLSIERHDIAFGMGRAQLEQCNLTAAQVQLERTREGLARRNQRDALEFERAKDRQHVGRRIDEVDANWNMERLHQGTQGCPPWTEAGQGASDQ